MSDFVDCPTRGYLYVSIVDYESYRLRATSGRPELNSTIIITD